MPTLDRHDDVFVLEIGDSENRFDPDWITLRQKDGSYS